MGVDSTDSAGLGLEVYQECADFEGWTWPRALLPLVHMGCGDWFAANLNSEVVSIHSYGGGEPPDADPAFGEPIHEWLQAWLDRGGEFGRNLT